MRFIIFFEYLVDVYVLALDRVADAGYQVTHLDPLIRIFLYNLLSIEGYIACFELLKDLLVIDLSVFGFCALEDGWWLVGGDALINHVQEMMELLFIELDWQFVE